MSGVGQWPFVTGGCDIVSSELPQFRKVKRSYAASIIHGALTSPRGAALLQLLEYDDHHFRAIFNLKHFQLAPGNRQPTKSQWNTLKKRLKRRDRTLFIFRDYGAIDCAALGKRSNAEACLYIDVGFLPN